MAYIIFTLHQIDYYHVYILHIILFGWSVCPEPDPAIPIWVRIHSIFFSPTKKNVFVVYYLFNFFFGCDSHMWNLSVLERIFFFFFEKQNKHYRKKIHWEAEKRSFCLRFVYARKFPDFFFVEIWMWNVLRELFAAFCHSADRR